MKTRQIITVFILLAGFCLLREVERKMIAQSQIWIEYASEMIDDKSITDQSQYSFAHLTTHQKLK